MGSIKWNNMKMKLSIINKFHTFVEMIVNKNVFPISLQTMTFCAVFETERSNFLFITKR